MDIREIREKVFELFEKALDEFVPIKYQLNDKEWESVFARFKRG